MSSPSTSEEEETISINAMDEMLGFNENSESTEMESLLEKQLLIEKGRINKVTADNQRLLSQNITLCQAVKQQKSLINSLQTRNNKLENQVSKLFLTVRALNKSEKINSVKEKESQKSLKHEFDTLKNAIRQKDEQINRLQNLNRKLSDDKYNIENEIHHTKNELLKSNQKYQSEKEEYESIINKHLLSIKDFNKTIDLLQSAMQNKDKILNGLQKENKEFRTELDDKDDHIKNISIQNNAQNNEIRELKQQNLDLQTQIASVTTKFEEIDNAYKKCIQQSESDNFKLQDILKQKEWWKNETSKLERECELNINKYHKMKMEFNQTQNNKYKQESIDIWRRKYYHQYWKRFTNFLAFQYALDQTHDVWNYLRKKYVNYNQSNCTNQQIKENFKESFKISMIKSLKDVKNLDIDQLLLCQDTKQLTNFLLSSNISPQTQLKVAASLLPIVEDYRKKLQSDIDTKIDNFIQNAKSTKTK